MTKDYLCIALATLFFFAGNSWGQDNPGKNEETANGRDPKPETAPPAPLQDSETKKLSGNRDPKTEGDPQKDTENKETANGRDPKPETAPPAPLQDSETKKLSGNRVPKTEGDPQKDTENKETAGVQNPDIEERPTQENGNKNSADTLHVILIIALLGIVLTFYGCAVLLLKQAKALNQQAKSLNQENKEVVRMLGQNQTRDPGGTLANTPPSENDNQFKADLNDKLDQVAKYMQIVSKSSTEATASSKETLAFAKQLSEAVVAKEQELGMLRDGYQQSMIGPVINGFLNLRDELNNILSTDLEAELKKQLEKLNQSVETSLSEVGVNELLLEIGSDPLTLESKKWRALEVTHPTNEEQLDGAVAEILKPGYTSVSPQGGEIVIRKAEVLRYKLDSQ